MKNNEIKYQIYKSNMTLLNKILCYSNELEKNKSFGYSSLRSFVRFLQEDLSGTNDFDFSYFTNKEIEG